MWIFLGQLCYIVGSHSHFWSVNCVVFESYSIFSPLIACYCFNGIQGFHCFSSYSNYILSPLQFIDQGSWCNLYWFFLPLSSFSEDHDHSFIGEYNSLQYTCQACLLVANLYIFFRCVYCKIGCKEWTIYSHVSLLLSDEIPLTLTLILLSFISSWMNFKFGLWTSKFFSASSVFLVDLIIRSLKTEKKIFAFLQNLSKIFVIKYIVLCWSQIVCYQFLFIFPSTLTISYLSFAQMFYKVF